MTTKLLLPLLVLWPWMTQSVALAQALAGPRAAAIPERPRGAPTGSVFIERVGDLSDEARERAVLRELRRGNVPSFLRQLRPVERTAVDSGPCLTTWPSAPTTTSCASR